MDNFVKEYIDFLSTSKTERKCTEFFVKEAEKLGFVNIETKTSIKPHDKVYYNKMGKALVMFIVGDKPLTDGFNILGSHIDSPRLDVKMNPLYNEDGIVYLNTHYYGGIKKYQWTALPLALYGVVCLKNGKTVKIEIGDKEGDPVFCISDILPHLADSQMKKNACEFIEAEKLDVLVGLNTEDDKKNKDSAKDSILKILKSEYGIEEKDFNSAEIEVVPQGNAKFLGFDKSMVLGYGQDDRVCAYSSFRAFIDVENKNKTTCLILSDKEEIGSYGATGMDSHLLENAVAELVDKMSEYSGKQDITIRKALASSYMLSSDVNAAYDPLNTDLYDKQNASTLGGGLVFNKYTGARGKSGASDANPEFIALIRNSLDKSGVKYQFAELGKVDVGGGGTIALYAAKYGMNVIDAGVAVLSMHAPWEITSASDILESYKGYKAFLDL